MDPVAPTTIWNPAFVRVFVAAGLQEGSFALLIHLPGYLSSLGGSEGQIGLVFSVSAVVALLLRPAAGRLLDLKGRQRVLRVVALVDVLAICGYLLVSSFGAPVYFVRMLQGTTEIMLFTGFLAYAADSLPVAKRTQGMAYFGLSGLVPIAFVPLLGDALLGWGGYATVFVAAAGLGFVGWLVVLTMPVLGIEHTGNRPRRSFLAAVTQREVLPVWIIVFTFAAALSVIFTFMATFVEERQVGSVGVFFVVYGLAAAGVRAVAANLPERFGARRVLTSTFVGMIVMYVLLATTGSLAGFLAAALLGGLGHGMAFPILSAAAVDRSRTNERGSALAFFTALFDMATLIVAPLIGATIDGAGYTAAFWVTTVVLTVGLGAYWLLDRRLGPADGPRVAQSAA
jgi:MFS family permease